METGVTKREAAEKVTVQQALDYYKGVSLNTILKTMNIENFDIQSALSSGKYVYVNKGDPYRDSGQHVILYKDDPQITENNYSVSLLTNSTTLGELFAK